MAELTHLDAQGQAHMVDVGAKAETEREAVAAGRVLMRPETLRLLRAGHKVVVIDEGFGLADEHFRRKAQSVLQRLYADASILVFASHNAELLRSTCERGIVLKDGKIAFDGSIADAIDFNHSY